MTNRKKKPEQKKEGEEPWETIDRILSGKKSRERKAIVLGAFLMLFGLPMMELGNFVHDGPMATTGTVFWAFGAISFIVGILGLIGFIDLDRLTAY